MFWSQVGLCFCWVDRFVCRKMDAVSSPNDVLLFLAQFAELPHDALHGRHISEETWRV